MSTAIQVCMHVYMSMCVCACVCVCANLSLYQGLHVIHHHCLLDIQVQDYCCLGYYLYQRGYGCVCVSLSVIWCACVCVCVCVCVCTCVCVCVCVCCEKEKRVGNGVCPLSIEWRLYAHILF